LLQSRGDALQRSLDGERTAHAALRERAEATAAQLALEMRTAAAAADALAFVRKRVVLLTALAWRQRTRIRVEIGGQQGLYRELVAWMQRAAEVGTPRTDSHCCMALHAKHAQAHTQQAQRTHAVAVAAQKALHTLRAHPGCACLPAGYCGYSVC
jgi:hypothetical protein